MSDKHFFRKPFPYVLGWAVLIFLLCNLRLNTSGGDTWYYFEGIDKVVHAGLFFVLSLLSCWAFYRQERFPRVSANAGWLALLTGGLYGGIIELLQGSVFTYRSAEWLDWLCDLAGAVLGLLAFGILKRSGLVKK